MTLDCIIILFYERKKAKYIENWHNFHRNFVSFFLHNGEIVGDVLFLIPCYYVFKTLKLDSHFPKKGNFVELIERPLKMMKNALYFTLKALFVLEIFTFSYFLFGFAEERLDKKAMALKFMTLQTGQQTITISQKVKATRQLNLVSY